MNKPKQLFGVFFFEIRFWGLGGGGGDEHVYDVELNITDGTLCPQRQPLRSGVMVGRCCQKTLCGV